jgi:hypothetical protein
LDAHGISLHGLSVRHHDRHDGHDRHVRDRELQDNHLLIHARGDARARKIAKIRFKNINLSFFQKYILKSKNKKGK